MPYIKQDRRERLLLFAAEVPQNAGELNFMFTMIAKNYLRNGGTSYQRLNDIVGALEGAKLELYRRVAAPYEDTKIEENGDVYNGNS